MKNTEASQYRHNPAKQIKKKPKDERRAFLEEEKISMIPEDFDTLPIEEVFKHKHVVFEANECFEKTGINLFDGFVSSYARSYGASLDEQKAIKQKLEENIYAVRFDPAFFLLWNIDNSSLAGYIPEFKTLFFPDMKTYRDLEMSTHEVTHAIGSICVNADGSKIEDHELYVALNEGITEKMTVEMIGKKKEGYAPNVKCAQFIDTITDGLINEAFQKYDISLIEKSYDEQIFDGAFKNLVIKVHGIENTFKEISRSNNVIFDFEEENDVNSAEFIKKYDRIKQIIDDEENLRLNFLKEKTQESKEKYLAQSDKTDEEFKKFKDEIIDYVLARECVKKYDGGKNINLICGRMADSFGKHLNALIDKSDKKEEQISLMQKFCNIEASFNFSENKIPILEEIIRVNTIKLYEKMTNTTLAENINVYEKLGVSHNLNWLNKATER